MIDPRSATLFGDLCKANRVSQFDFSDEVGRHDAVASRAHRPRSTEQIRRRTLRNLQRLKKRYRNELTDDDIQDFIDEEEDGDWRPMSADEQKLLARLIKEETGS